LFEAHPSELVGVNFQSVGNGEAVVYWHKSPLLIERGRQVRARRLLHQNVAHVSVQIQYAEVKNPNFVNFVGWEKIRRKILNRTFISCENLNCSHLASTGIGVALTVAIRVFMEHQVTEFGIHLLFLRNCSAHTMGTRVILRGLIHVNFLLKSWTLFFGWFTFWVVSLVFTVKNLVRRKKQVAHLFPNWKRLRSLPCPVEVEATWR